MAREKLCIPIGSFTPPEILRMTPRQARRWLDLEINRSYRRTFRLIGTDIAIFCCEMMIRERAKVLRYHPTAAKAKSRKRI